MSRHTQATQTSTPSLDNTNESSTDTRDAVHQIPLSIVLHRVEASDRDWSLISPSNSAGQSMSTHPPGLVRNTDQVHDEGHELNRKNLALLNIGEKKDFFTDPLLPSKESSSAGSAGTRHPSSSRRSSKGSGDLDKPPTSLPSAQARNNDLKDVGSWSPNKDTSVDHHSVLKLPI